MLKIIKKTLLVVLLLSAAATPVRVDAINVVASSIIGKTLNIGLGVGYLLLAEVFAIPTWECMTLVKEGVRDLCKVPFKKTTSHEKIIEIKDTGKSALLATAMLLCCSTVVVSSGIMALKLF